MSKQEFKMILEKVSSIFHALPKRQWSFIDVIVELDYKPLIYQRKI